MNTNSRGIAASRKKIPWGFAAVVLAVGIVLPSLPVRATAATPLLSLNPGSGVVGSAVTATGSGFSARVKGSLAFGGTVVSNFRTSSRGAFSLSFAVPSGYSGDTMLKATVAVQTASATFHVVVPTPAPAPAPAPEPAPEPTPQPSGETAFGPTSGRPFTPTSAWNTPIPLNPVADPASGTMVGYLGTAGGHVANLYQYANPVWDADASTPRYQVTCTMPWGTCDLARESVPIPAGAKPSPGTDGAMAIIDWSTGKSYEFWQFRWESGKAVASWGSIMDIKGTGSGGQAVGAGVSRLAGVVRTFEMTQGRIDHALVFATNNACPRVYRYPATKTDGSSSRADCIPEGARVQLDPTIDLDTLGLNKAERIVAEALQRYGAYNIDNGGAKMAFIFEMPSGEADPYPALGFEWDYWGMERIPWSKLRVLKNWDGSGA